MKKFKVKLKDGETLLFSGSRLVHDGQGVHVYDAGDDIVATFKSNDVTMAYEVQE